MAERVIYGSSRLGINTNKVDMLDEDPEEVISLGLGNKLYEMSNHLGNVLTVINDIKIPQSSNSVDVDGYLATIVSTADYSPFGVQLDERTESAESYRFGFQGQEVDNEIKGAGNSVNYTYRMHDPRLGRFFAVDPLSAEYPFYSPYAFSGNRVVDSKELEGLEPASIHVTWINEDGSRKSEFDEANPRLGYFRSDYLENAFPKCGLRTMDYPQGSHLRIVINRQTGDVGTLCTPVTVIHGKRKEEKKVKKSLGQRLKENGPIAFFGEKATQWAHEHSWFGSHDGGNQGTWDAKDTKYAITMISAIVTIGTGGGSLLLGAEGWSANFAITGIVNATDDITGLTTSDGLTMIQKVLGKNVGTAFKIIGSFTTSRAALTDALNNMNDVERATMSIISATNDQGQVVYGLIQVDSQKGKND